MLTRMKYAVLLILCLTIYSAPAAGQEPAATARNFVELFFAGDDTAYQPMLTADMRAALPAAAAAQIRADLQARHGPLQSTAAAWLQDVVGEHRRYRVPGAFARETIDLLVVLDAAGKVAGFFHVPHVPSPAELAVDETLSSAPNPAVEGHWEGEVTLPGAPLLIRVDLHHRDGYWAGTIDIPAQGAEELPLTDFAIDGDAVSFVMADVPGDPVFAGRLTGGEIAGTFNQSGFTAPFRLGRGVIAEPGRPQQPQPPFPYDDAEVAYDNGPVRIAGTLSVPHGEGPFAVVLLISGSGAQDRDETIYGHRPFLVLADHLARAGIAVLRVDDRGVGASTGDRSTATTEDFADDVLAGVDFLTRRPEIDRRRIGLIGHSEGGIIAPMVATRSDDVAFIVLLAGTGVRGDEVILRQVELISRAEGLPADQVAEAVTAQRDLFHLLSVGAGDREVRAKLREVLRAQFGAEGGEESVEEVVDEHLRQARLPWFRFFLDYDPRPALRRVEVPVLALCGGKDLQVDPEQNLTEIFMALAEGGNDRFAIEELPGLNHMFQRAETGSPTEYYTIEETVNPAALESVSGWILERFGDGAEVDDED